MLDISRRRPRLSDLSNRGRQKLIDLLLTHGRGLVPHRELPSRLVRWLINRKALFICRVDLLDQRVPAVQDRGVVDQAVLDLGEQ